MRIILFHALTGVINLGHSKFSRECQIPWSPNPDIWHPRYVSHERNSLPPCTPTCNFAYPEVAFVKRVGLGLKSLEDQDVICLDNVTAIPGVMFLRWVTSTQHVRYVFFFFEEVENFRM
ncbi:hypothetical protein NPIL_219601 [Nephila pilipes]|uniref:Uncharacterized protein n=1 Tax=Nephila pilipes TaxID=299642 RepID=A0A8X6N2C9_NEPPI|nr:hypothetical protein NPIL_219601 [Nephila pilipes]